MNMHKLRVVLAAVFLASGGAVTVKSASAYTAIEYALMAFHVTEDQIPILDAFGD
jgi:hypothetical protein